jgi:uncharacterized protein YecE (DUF72 family)
MHLHVGCAMWTHKAWQGHVSNRTDPAHDRLRAYAGWCNAVEGNTTFYATPPPATVASWAEQTGPEFRFVLKLPRAVSHEGRLAAAEPEVGRFLDAVEPLGPRVHALWIQLPPSFGPTDVPALETLLARLPRSHRWAVEVRHPRFFTDPAATRELERTCAVAGAEWVPFDTTAFFARPPADDAEREAWDRKPRLPRRSTALTAHPVVRYLGRNDPAATIAGWQPWLPIVAGWLREGRSPTFVLHTPDNADAPPLARRFHAEVRALAPELAPLPTPEPVEQATLF